MIKRASLTPVIRVILILLAATLFVFSATCAYAATVQITGSTVNVRSGPGTTYEKVASVSAGGQYNLVVKGNGWYKIALGGGKYGWVSASYAKVSSTVTTSTTTTSTTTPSSAIPSDYSNYKQGTVNTNSLNLRQGPSTSYTAVAKLSSGTGLSIYSTSGSWYKVVTLSGQSGWVSASYVTLKDTKTAGVTINNPATTTGNNPNSNGSLSGKIIYLDPGHGDYSTTGSGTVDKGSDGFGLYESDITWAITQLVYKQLQTLGANVYLTRSETPANQTLYDRANKANDAGADLYISIHTNAFSSESANGTSTWTYAPEGNSKYDRDTRLRLANCLQNALVAATGLANYGVREANFAVTRETNMPAALIETAFITNASDNAFLASDNGQAALAAGIVNGIVAYFSGSTNTTSDSMAVVELTAGKPSDLTSGSASDVTPVDLMVTSVSN